MSHKQKFRIHDWQCHLPTATAIKFDSSGDTAGGHVSVFPKMSEQSGEKPLH